MSNYTSFVVRINKTNTIDGLNKLQVSLARIYDAGQFTASELKRLDLKIIDKIISLEP